MEISILVLLLVLKSSFSFILEKGDDAEFIEEKTISWPSVYHFNGEKIYLSNGVTETFELWYSEEAMCSRMDYNNGTVSTFTIGSDSEDEFSGMALMVHPETDYNMNVTRECSPLYSGEDLEPLPDTENYTYVGKKIFNHMEVELWESDYSDKEELRTLSSLYVYQTKKGYIPIQLIIKSFWAWTGAVARHSITSYYHFDDTFDEDILKYSLQPECEYYAKEGLKGKLPKLRPPHQIVDPDFAFASFKSLHQKEYPDDEHELRKTAFEANWRRVREHNAKNLTYKMELNKYADWTPRELSFLTGTRPSNPESMGTIPFPLSFEELEDVAEQLPEELDLRMQGVVPRVKNQGSCGSCWSFAVTGAVEIVTALNNGGMIFDLSEQSLVDCAWPFSNFGCGGGMLDSAFNYVTEYGIPTEKDYGDYLQQDGVCKIKEMERPVKIKGYSKVTEGSVNAMKYALNHHGPVVVGIYATEDILMYSNGIFYDLKCAERNRGINHAVLVVGYGVRDGQLFWIVKNSWGEDWGMDGYVLMSAQDDNCHVLAAAYYPIV